MFNPRKKTLNYFIYLVTAFLVIQILMIIWNKFNEFVWKQTPLILYWPQADYNIECYNAKGNDALLSVEDPSFSPKTNSIFFHETSCRGGLDSRQACAVESAARANPDWEVYLLFNAPVSNVMLTRSCLVKLLEYQNIKLARIHAYSFSKDTLVYPIVTKELWKSKHPIEHTADIMKMLTLNRWGGVYLDLDVLVKRSFSSLPKNWIAKDSTWDLASGAMRFSKDEVGQNITAEVIREIAATYDTQGWSVNGALAIQRVLQRRCPDVVVKDGGICEGISVFDKEMFYPITFSGAHVLVKEGPVSEVKGEPYAYHMWNLLTKIYTVHPHSAYVKLASQVCPTVYQAYGDAFGV